jgi:hypothetical protein
MRVREGGGATKQLVVAPCSCQLVSVSRIIFTDCLLA